jgi:hypothetical protein
MYVWGGEGSVRKHTCTLPPHMHGTYSSDSRTCVSIWMKEGYVRVPFSIQLAMYVLPTLPCIPHMPVGRGGVREGGAVPELGHIEGKQLSGHLVLVEAQPVCASCSQMGMSDSLLAFSWTLRSC